MQMPQHHTAVASNKGLHGSLTWLWSCRPRPSAPKPSTFCRQSSLAPRASSRDEPDPLNEQGTRSQPPTLPAFMDGVNWYCYACMGLLFLTDFTPLGQWLLAASSGPLSSSSFPLRLAALQWTVFVVPTLLWVKRAGWGFSKTFKLQAGTPKQLLTGLAAGPVLWLAVNAAIVLRTGSAQELVAAFTGGQPAAAAAAGGGAVSPGMLLLGIGEGGDWGLQQGLTLLLFAAASPAVAEELLFRGLLLTAVQQRLGATDAVAVVAALFALIHLDLQQFFLYCVLGGACGLLAVRSGSVWPAVGLHATFNATAVAAALLLHR